MSLLGSVKAALFEVIDPELGINIVDLGLIYDVQVEGNHAKITMTLTTPGCPLHDSITNGVKFRVNQLKGIDDVTVDLVWEPAWSPDKMSERAKEKLHFG
ncbi:metal-sulfur cluster assembly factor [Cerasibacillus terrae]|uniref:Metal-sulfur cluster assembly factor n=1 Tax=Cerasibacillus terrae TaxID=2498845 RepID=A0A5C8NXQ0_9BACI|nr:metal-sulfur cluster assembly factor [Cerasibacillus terrae]TXL65743.1 metal-sulfur cluster assembly factor [Cerasibacillus terrae]